ncbi:MAG TPA: 16S rRNA (cytidine(1402)-2'-O)-methyltransferase [Hyphomicrobiales bacterium]|nr:16S rRNA (cytidine(1402)-2'-O)-methyltransferase [Hyphomicrobiales bacterium]
MPRRISRAAGAGASSQGQQRQRGYSVAGAIIEVPQADAGLHVVATPIGNLGDITLRALRILAGADAVICEDSRVSARLLAHYGISTPLVTYHDHNAEKVRPRLMARLAAGDALALITDAGTPLVSDPGYRLVQETIASGIALTAAPGPAAPVNALVLSGLPSDRFFFEGFLPPRQAARRKRLAALAAIPATLLFFESPRRLGACLADMAEVLGPRGAAVAREMTKRFEELRRGELPVLAAHYEGAAPRGEIVIAVAPPLEGAGEGAGDLDEMLTALLADMSLRDAVAEAVARSGLDRKSVYARALELARKAKG